MSFAGSIINDAAKGLSLVDTATQYAGFGLQGHLRLNKGGQALVNIQAPWANAGVCIIAGQNFQASSTKAYVKDAPGTTKGGWYQGNCEATFEWTAGVGSWKVVHNGVTVSEGSGTGKTITVTAGPK